jgi:sugar/nucleoside kinase (ribokinase family)
VNTTMESDPTANVFVLPAREGEQRLHGYVRQHLQLIEQALSFGIPYTAITEAGHTAGFAGTSVHTVEQAMYRARRHKPRFAVTLEPRPAPEATPSPLPRSSLTPRITIKEDMAAIRRRFQELARPPKPGEPDPLN